MIGGRALLNHGLVVAVGGSANGVEAANDFAGSRSGQYLTYLTYLTTPRTVVSQEAPQ